ncbi:ABC transporter substrate-binding subunit SaoX [Clostridium sp.]|uniref:ABC transporter substrate-binding subunit SaoX n=1 Tax=Clostridium sp. TaxID=1506 RepID=UPI003216466A
MNKKLRNLIVGLCVTATSVGLIGCGGAGKGEGSKVEGSKVEDKTGVIESIKNMKLPALKDDYSVKLGYYNCDHMTAACIGKDSGIYEALGLKVDVTGNGKVPQAMSAGQMDAGYIGFQNVVKGISKGTPITIAANNHEGGSYYLVVSNDIKEPKDLIGQKLGIGSEPEGDWSWRQMSKDMGIPLEGSNYEGINFDSDKSAYMALKTGKIKGYTACDPWGSMAEYEKTGKILKVFDSVDGETTICCVFALNTNFANEHAEVAERLMLAHTKSIEYLYSNPYKAAKIFAENYSVPEEVALMTVYKKTVKEGRTITWDIDNNAIEKRMKENIDHGDYEDVDRQKLIQTELLDKCGRNDFSKFMKEKIDPIFPIGMTYEDWILKAKEIAGEK